MKNAYCLYRVSTKKQVDKAKLNQIVRGWINYYGIGSMKQFMDKFGQWLRHKVRVVIIKQWKKPKRIYANLQSLDKKLKSNMTDEDIYKVANTRLGLYRRCGMNVVNYLLSPGVLALPNEKRKRSGLINPLEYYLSKMQ
ncbi:MAG: group II intron maturase-specific domain-containing protein [Clostridiales bacterium]|nr:group II intron maturase-specific domain-containing protein [Clostridiales bacterium]